MIFKYILKKLLVGLFTIFMLITLTFTAMHIVPGDPISDAKAMSKEIRANLEEKYGLNKPITTQYIIFLKRLLHGDFGISFTQKNRSVNDIIAGHFPVSALLGLLALGIATFGGILFGSISAIYKNKWLDTTITLLVLLGVSIPSFILAALGQLGMIEINEYFNLSIFVVGGFDGIHSLIVPALFLGLSTMSSLSSIMRSSMIEVANSDYIKTAKVKRLSSTRIFFKHQLRNSILPIITFLGPGVVAITTGSFAVESIFAIPGLGLYFVQSIQQLDYTVIMGLTAFYGSYLVLITILVDIIYGIVDPRIRLGEKS